MNKRVKRIVSQLKKDLNPDTADIQITEEDFIQCLPGDSCIKIAKNGDLTARLSENNKHTAMVICGILLQVLNKTGQGLIQDTVAAYEEYCDEVEGELEETPINLIQEESSDTLKILEDKIFMKQVENKVQETLSNIDPEEDTSVVQVMRIPVGSFILDQFDKMPDIVGVPTLKVIIEEN